MQSIQELNNELSKLRIRLNADNCDEVILKMREIDGKITAAKTLEMLKKVNAKQQRLRQAAAIVWECEQPSEDITTNGGQFHKVKVKKYPKLAALTHVYGNFKDGVLLEITIDGEKITMYRTSYKSNEPNTYTRPASFEDFLKLNQISPADITVEQFAEIKTAIDAANKEIKEQIEAYSKKMDSLNAYALECWGLVHNSSEHLYLKHTN